MSEKVWRKIPGLVFETASWGAQFVLFNRLSGDTHLLNPPVDWLLDQIDSEPISLSELIGIAAETGILSENDNHSEMFAGLLNELEKIDLLESVSAV